MPFVIAEHDVRVARAEDDPAVLYDARSGGPDHIGLVLKHGGKGGTITVTIDSGGEPESHTLRKSEATVLLLIRPLRITAWSDGDAATLGVKLLAEEPRPTTHHQDSHRRGHGDGHDHDRSRGGRSHDGHGHSDHRDSRSERGRDGGRDQGHRGGGRDRGHRGGGHDGGHQGGGRDGGHRDHRH